MIIFMAAFIVIDGSFLALFSVIFSLWHELWHILAIKYYGKRFGLISKSVGFSINSSMLSYRQEFFVCLAGPLSSLFLALLFLPFALKTEYLMFACFTNAALFLINIIPIYPLDGGRILYAYLCERLTLDSANKISKCVTHIFLLPLLIISVIIFIRTGYNLSLLMITIYLLALGVKNI